MKTASKRFFLSIIFLFVFCCNCSFSQFQQQDLDISSPQNISSFTGKRASHQSIIINNTLYILGGYLWENAQGSVYKDVQFLSLGQHIYQPTSKWNKTTDMNKQRTGLGVATHNGFIYAIGGSDENWQYLSSIEFSKVNKDGSLNEWKLSPNNLNIPRSNLSAGVFISKSGQAYLYAIAGVGQVGDKTVHFASIEFAPINADGSIGKWLLAAFNMKGGRSTPASIVYENKLFVIGGWGDILFDDVFSDIQYADINEDGSLNPWHTSPNELRMRIFGHTATLADISNQKYILVIAGTLGEGNTTDFIEYAKANSTIGIGPLIMSSTRISGRRWGHATAYAGGNMYVTGGSEGNSFMNDVQVLNVKLK